jgi:hypothetical protein
LKATAGAWNLLSIEKKLGSLISEEEYRLFVEPFEGMNRLKDINAVLKPGEIIEPIKISTSKTRIIEFPENLSLNQASYKNLHNLLATLGKSSFGFRDSDTFAQHQKLENQRAHILRFIWILGKYGQIEKNKVTRLVVDAETYLNNRGREKTLAIWSFVEDIVFKVLSEFGVCCERFILKGVKNEDLTTGTGYLRKKGWAMKMSFEKKIGGVASLNALQDYIKKVDKKYGNRGFNRFQKADMKFLLES